MCGEVSPPALVRMPSLSGVAARDQRMLFQVGDQSCIDW
jgi:hypothetical protein